MILSYQTNVSPTRRLQRALIVPAPVNVYVHSVSLPLASAAEPAAAACDLARNYTALRFPPRVPSWLQQPPLDGAGDDGAAGNGLIRVTLSHVTDSQLGHCSILEPVEGSVLSHFCGFAEEGVLCESSDCLAGVLHRHCPPAPAHSSR